MSLRKNYGWKPQTKDIRDYKFKAPAFVDISSLPKKVDLRKYDSPIQDQGNLGSCTAHAATSILQLLNIKKAMPTNIVLFYIVYALIRAWRVIVYFITVKPYVFPKNLSRLFVYYNMRELWAATESDSGGSIRDTIKALAKQGVCLEKNWLYNVAQFAMKPSDECYKEATTHVISEYKALDTIDDMKACLHLGMPFMFGFYICESFNTSPIKTTGIVNMPTSSEEIISAHAVMCLGYDDEKQAFLIRNSWGADFGLKGYFYLPYAYISDSTLTSDFWTITKEV